MSEFSGFWKNLERPIIGLAPMDGVTDFAFRAMMARHGRPSVIFTEFTTATGLFYSPERVLQSFEFSGAERPVVAQIFGNNPDDFYKAAHVVCELGFDGIDINMGCPSKNVTSKCGGAKLICEPELAVAIIRATQNGVKDWANGQKLESLAVSEELLQTIEKMNEARENGWRDGGSCRGGVPRQPTSYTDVGGLPGNDRPRHPPAGRPASRQAIPVSVKTRLGVKEIVIETWIATLLAEKPAVISIHGRTLKQMYKGEADWSAIAKAAAVAKGSGTLILGNGDIHSRTEALRRIEETGVDGVLIGRSAIGNPWIFQSETKEIGAHERCALALEHCRYFEERHPERFFPSLRKHLSQYLRHFPEAGLLRQKALQAANSQELEEIFIAFQL